MMLALMAERERFIKKQAKMRRFYKNNRIFAQ
jgi:hypothetical protein